MSDIAAAREETGDSLFRGRTVALILAMGILGFFGMLVLGAFQPDLRSGHNGGTHALSTGAVGFSGLVELARATGRNPRIVRNEHLLGGEDLLVVTPPHGFVDLGAILSARTSKPTLLVMPKWDTSADDDHPGWVRFSGVLPSFDPEALLSPATKFRVRRVRSGGAPLTGTPEVGPAVRFTAPHPLQTIVGVRRGQDQRRTTLRPLIVDRDGRIVLGGFTDSPLYILADPDLLDNLGMADARQAAAALALLDALNSTGATGVDFDLTANGFGHSQSPLKLALTPPFLALTLTLAAVLLLTGLHALGRFGPVARRTRAIAFGKAALVANAAALVRKAGREARLGGRYVQVIRERAAAAFGAPARLPDAALDDYLDRLERGGRFTDLARAVEAAGDRPSLVLAARALHDWQKERRG